MRVKPRFQRERARERERRKQRVCFVPRVQLTINAMLAIIRSGSERVRRVAKLTNFIGPGYVLTHRRQVVHVHVQILPARNFITIAQLRVRKIRTAPSFSRSLFRVFGHATRFDWMRFDKKYDDREGSLCN